MIKVGILGASTPQAGEIIRILVNHPDVEMVFAYDTVQVGHPVADIHHGLIGECTLTVTEAPSLTRLDAVIICASSPLAAKIALNPGLYPRLKVIDVTGEYGSKPESAMILGLSEVNRKPLVRGATRAVLQSSAVAAAAVALYPFAASLLLNSDISVRISGFYADDTTRDAGALEEYLQSVQNSFGSHVDLSVDSDREECGQGRGMRAVIEFDCTLRQEDARSLYDPVYDDHNFTFITSREVEVTEVEGTQKCIILISKPSAGTMRLDIVVDGVMRGGAGDAVHVLNLLFGLHERTGLALKASTY